MSRAPPRGWLVAAAVLLLAGSAGAGDRWVVSQRFGETGRGRNELKDPVDVALLRDGRIAVLDTDRETVVLFDRIGRWVRTLGGRRGEGDLHLKDPAALALAPTGELWVVDRGHHRLVEVDLQGQERRVVGSMGSAEGRFNRPEDLVFDRTGRMYVADSGNRRVQIFDRSGDLLEVWRGRGARYKGRIETPVVLALTQQGGQGLWVYNRGSKRLERFDLDGRWAGSLDLPPTGDDTVVEPSGIWIDPIYHRMFLSDPEGHRIVVKDKWGETIAEVEGEAFDLDPAGLVGNRRFDLYVADRAGKRVVRFTRR